MKKELAMHEPMIKGFNIYGSLFSILKDTEEVKNWICNNFIQLRYLGGDNVVFFETYRQTLYNCPNITVSRVCRNQLKLKWSNDILNFVKEMIDENYYVLLYIDRYYITSMNRTCSSTHELFIYGYDFDNKVLFCADNIAEGQYRQFQCPMDEFEKAYWSLPDNTYWTDIHCITTEFSSDILDKIKLPIIYKLLKDYINSDVTVIFGERFSIQTYGFQIHNEINNNIKNIEANKKIDIRPIYTIFEHKDVMIYRLKCLNEFLETDKFDPLIKAYMEIRDLYEIISGLIVKYNVTFKSKIVTNICEHFEKAIDLEKSLFDDLMRTIEGFMHQ